MQQGLAGRWPRSRRGAEARRRAGTLVVLARPLGSRLPVARRGRRARRAWRRGMVRRAVLAGCADSRLGHNHQFQPPHRGPGRPDRGCAGTAAGLGGGVPRGRWQTSAACPRRPRRPAGALAMARDLGDPAGEAYALFWLGAAAQYVGDNEAAKPGCGRCSGSTGPAIPGWILRPCTIHLADALSQTGEAAEAQRYCADALPQARQAGAPLTRATAVPHGGAGPCCRADGRGQGASAPGPRGVCTHQRQRAPAQLPRRVWGAVRGGAALGGNHHSVGGLRCRRPGRPDAICGSGSGDGRASRALAQSAPGAGARRGPRRGRTRRRHDRRHRRRVRPAAGHPGSGSARPRRARRGSAPANANWSPWSPAAAPTPRSPNSSTSASGPSAPTWTGSATRPDAAAAPTSPASPWKRAWSNPPPGSHHRPAAVGSATPSATAGQKGVTRPLPRSIAGQATCESPADLSRRPEKEEHGRRRKRQPADPLEAVMNPIRRTAAILAGLTTTALAFTAASPAAFAIRGPPPGDSGGPAPAPPQIHTTSPAACPAGRSP